MIAIGILDNAFELEFERAEDILIRLDTTPRSLMISRT
jgi:hypothetical protein